MFETLKTFGIICTAMILAYGSIAIFFIGPRCSFRILKRAFIQIRVLAALGRSRNQNMPLSPDIKPLPLDVTERARSGRLTTYKTF